MPPKSRTPEILSYDDLGAFGIPFSRTHIWRLEKQGAFPRHIDISKQRIGWLRSEIEEWLEARIAERDAA